MRAACSKPEFQDTSLKGSLVLSISRSTHWLLGVPRTHSSDSLALAEGSERLLPRRDPKVAIALPLGPPLHRHSVNRSYTKRRSRYVFRSKRMRRESKVVGSGTGPKRHGQIPLTWHASMKAWSDRHPAGNPLGTVSPGVAHRWHTIVAAWQRSGQGTKRETKRKQPRQEHQSKLRFSKGPSVSSSSLESFDLLKGDLPRRHL